MKQELYIWVVKTSENWSEPLIFDPELGVTYWDERMLPSFGYSKKKKGLLDQNKTKNNNTKFIYIGEL